MEVRAKTANALYLVLILFGLTLCSAYATSTPNTTTPNTAMTTPGMPLTGTTASRSLANNSASNHTSLVDKSPPSIRAPEAPHVQNPYGFGQLWKHGDVIARGTILVLVIMSASTWYVLITKLLEQQTLLRNSRRANETFWVAPTVNDGMETLNKKSPFFFLVKTGLEAVDHHELSMLASIDANTWLTISIQRVADQIISRLQGGLSVLATVGSVAPFVGLFGTVFGIYHALVAIGIAGQASIGKVAGPVGEALIMTGLGLATAVPAVLSYNLLVRRNKLCTERIRGFANDLHSLLISGKVLNQTSHLKGRDIVRTQATTDELV